MSAERDLWNTIMAAHRQAASQACPLPPQSARGYRVSSRWQYVEAAISSSRRAMNGPSLRTTALRAFHSELAPASKPYRVSSRRAVSLSTPRARYRATSRDSATAPYHVPSMLGDLAIVTRQHLGHHTRPIDSMRVCSTFVSGSVNSRYTLLRGRRPLTAAESQWPQRPGAL